MVERLRERVTTEQLNQRVLRLLAQMEAALRPTIPADAPRSTAPRRRKPRAA
jgi:hypothetical protein